MPNWCAGSLRIRGPVENLKKFITEGLNAYKWECIQMKEVKLERSKWLETGEDGLGEWFCFKANSLYIEGTNSAFIKTNRNNSQFHYWGDVEDSNNTIIFDFQQAWNIREEEWVELSCKYGINFRLYGFECGGEFCREVEVLDGKLTIDKTIRYNDWDWECPMPMMGG